MAYAQETYKHCLDGERTKWSVIYEFLDYGESSKEFMAYGDTIINDISYRKIYAGEYYEYDNTNIKWKDRMDHGSESEWEEYYIRETDDASKLYIYDADQQKEYLISDMNLTVGDKFPIPEIWEDFRNFMHIDDTLEVNSVYIKDGLKYIQFDHSWPAYFYVPTPEDSNFGYGYYITFIEGIGPNVGILCCESWFPLPQVINCFQNQSIYYKNEYVSYPCGYFRGDDAISNVFSDKDYSVEITENKIEIHSIKEPAQIVLYDLLGKILYNQSFSAGQNIHISRDNFPQGVYLLKIYTKNGKQSQTVKIIS
ncbi:hypothetical protein AGMMS50262_17420 [Bacteroidia bacterium]|nr:hypothetical protein AGMMS50262_17420 [Bacteroidia bacterium]